MNEKYIKMCQKAYEIQEEFKIPEIKEGDYENDIMGDYLYF